MTSFAFILGVVPLVIATGAGAEMRQSLGTAVFSGMLGVTLFGLLFTPVFYVVVRWIGRLGRRQARGRGRRSPAVVTTARLHLAHRRNVKVDRRSLAAGLLVASRPRWFLARARRSTPTPLTGAPTPKRRPPVARPALCRPACRRPWQHGCAGDG